MTVQELFRSVLWEDVRVALAKLYPDKAEALFAFREAFDYIKNCEARPNPEGWEIEIDFWRDDEGRDVWDVRARRPGDDGVYGMDYSLLDEWAGYFVAERVLADLPSAEAAAHILWEATWYGFTNEEILARSRELEEAEKELQRNLEMGVSAEEFWEELDSDESEEP